MLISLASRQHFNSEHQPEQIDNGHVRPCRKKKCSRHEERRVHLGHVMYYPVWVFMSPGVFDCATAAHTHAPTRRRCCCWRMPALLPCCCYRSSTIDSFRCWLLPCYYFCCSLLLLAETAYCCCWPLLTVADFFSTTDCRPPTQTS